MANNFMRVLDFMFYNLNIRQRVFLMQDNFRQFIKMNMNMKTFTSVFLAALGIVMSMGAAGQEFYAGVTLGSAQTSWNGTNNTPRGIAMLFSARTSKYWGMELQAGYFGKSGPFEKNTEVDFTGLSMLPFWSSGFKLYGKAGLADVYSWSSYSVGSGPKVSANKLGLTYGAGLELQRSYWVARLGFQRLNFGSNKLLPPSLSTNMVGLTWLVTY